MKKKLIESTPSAVLIFDAIAINDMCIKDNYKPIRIQLIGMSPVECDIHSAQMTDIDAQSDSDIFSSSAAFDSSCKLFEYLVYGGKEVKPSVEYEIKIYRQGTSNPVFTSTPFSFIDDPTECARNKASEKIKFTLQS